MKRSYEDFSNEETQIKRTPQVYKELGFSLIEAVRSKNEDVVKTLLDEGVDPNFKCDSNNVIIEAIWDKSIGIIKMLLVHGADVNSKDNFDNTPLTYAMRGQNLEVIETLLNSGATVNHINYKGESALSYALGENSANLVKILLKFGADINFEDIRSQEILNLIKFAEFTDDLLVNDDDTYMQGKFSENDFLTKLGFEDQEFMVVRIKRHLDKLKGDLLKSFTTKRVLESNIQEFGRVVEKDMTQLCHKVLDLDTRLNHEDGFPKLKSLTIQSIAKSEEALKKFVLFPNDLKELAKKMGWYSDVQGNLENTDKVSTFNNLSHIKAELTNNEDYNQLTTIGSLLNETD